MRYGRMLEENLWERGRKPRRTQVPHRYKRHDGESSKSAEEDEGLGLLQRQQYCYEESLVPKL